MARVHVVLSLVAAAVLACDPTGGRSVREDTAAPDGGSVDASDAGIGDAAVTDGCSPPGTCLTFVPTGAVSEGDVRTAGLLPITIGASTTLDGVSGAIAGVRAAGTGIVDGIGFRVATRMTAEGASYAVGVFSFASLTVDAGATLSLRGANAVALAAATRVRIDGVIDARGDCAGAAPGPGGFAGGASNGPGGGPGGGKVASGVGTTDPGGGGGGYGVLGGRGGPTQQGTFSAAGIAYGSAELVDLVGGSGGADGFNGGSPGGGGGGGAVQIVSFQEVVIGSGSSVGGVNAGGCGGIPSAGSGGGGGAGGAILVEAPRIRLAANGVLAANGGAGGQAESAAAPREHGALGDTPAPGAGGGGAGGAGASPVGKDGTKPGGAAGGGGGGCGRIRLHSLDPVELEGITSPARGSGTTLSEKSPG